MLLTDPWSSVKGIAKDFQIFQVLPHLKIHSNIITKRILSIRESTTNKYNLVLMVEALAAVDNQCFFQLQLNKIVREYPK